MKISNQLFRLNKIETQDCNKFMSVVWPSKEEVHWGCNREYRHSVWVCNSYTTTTEETDTQCVSLRDSHTTRTYNRICLQSQCLTWWEHCICSNAMFLRFTMIKEDEVQSCSRRMVQISGVEDFHSVSNVEDMPNVSEAPSVILL